ncbi:MAG: N-6 DNA methylase [Nostoc sp. ChiSLP02]|nr:N-6 DNA methylase [Nostoc sp. DedSLP05]MDZ8102712.1 N-6 DNA methylase [Nostoc sp. DedSLP01]MDZ8186943.1 N-6 DNA methylase [Nostoc sp. ChiSLP02]
MLNKTEIEYTLWQALDILHRKYASGESVDCVLKLLLFKRLSDQSRIEKRTQLSVPKEARWSVIEAEQYVLADKLSEALTTIEKVNSQLEGVFTNSEMNFWNRFDNETLRHVIKLISKLDISDENFNDLSELGKATEELIEKRDSIEPYRRSIYTPQQVTKLMVELIKPQQKTSIYDPVCGSGEFLAESVKFVKKLGGNLSQLHVYGQDADLQKCATTKINLIFHGSYNFDIRLGNAILKPCFLQEGKPRVFDIVLANPPFNVKYHSESLKNINYNQRFDYGIPSNGIGNYLFIQHILSSLGDKGKAAVIQPRGVLSREGDEGEIRKRIIEADLIEAVIEIAPKLFYNFSIPVVIMIFNRSKYHKNQILFIDASSEYEARRGQNFLQTEHIDRIVCAYSRWEDEEGFAKIVSIEEIAKNDYSLSVDRYVIPPTDEKIDITSEVSKLHRLEAERSELERKIDGYLQALGIKL